MGRKRRRDRELRYLRQRVWELEVDRYHQEVQEVLDRRVTGQALARKLGVV